ncbi:MAG: hypothetical protein ABI867_17770 [Kofleriaceae bacterium]
MKLSILALVAVAACGSTHTVRFANAPVVTRVDDSQNVPKAPAEHPFAQKLYHFRGNVSLRLERGLEVRRERRSIGVNAFDEVPDSTWFTNRIGVRALTTEEIQHGSIQIESPEAHLPWTIKSTKIGGASVGFIIKDARGETFVLKFDEPEMPEVETSADAIVGRLLWSVGFNISEDHVVYFRATDLKLTKDAKIKDWFGNGRPLRQPDLDKLLAKVSIGADGRYRGLASRFLGGKRLGGHPDEGVRSDDPNDLIPHERRRELRGSRPIFAWLDHVDVKEDNTIDMYIPDGDRHYVRHYLIDFGKSLGCMAMSATNPRRSFQYALDFAALFKALLTFGLTERPWQGRTSPPILGVALLDTAKFKPELWSPNTASYYPFLLTDRIDGFWGAKLVMRFTREQIRAAVDMGRLTDPRAAEFITDALVERQKKTGRYYFSQVAPLDGFAIEGSQLCFDDLMLTNRLAPVLGTTYTLATSDRNGRALAEVAVPAQGSGRTCTPIQLAGDGDGYTIVRIRAKRQALDRSMYVHVARRDGAAHVIGLWRE